MKRLLLGITLYVLPTLAFALDVVFRYDDFRLVDDSLQNEMIELFSEEKVPLCVAVIPCDKDFNFVINDGIALNRIKEIHDAGYLPIALHGCTHQGETVNGELLSLNRNEQQSRLSKGADFLDTVFWEHVHIFIPPWNRYDTTTLDILAGLGYNIISADIADSRNVSDPRFQYYPEGIDHPRKLHKLIEKNANREGLVVCMFHRYDLTNDYTLEDLSSTLRWIKNVEGVRITSFDTIYSETQAFNKIRIQQNLVHPLLSKVLYTRPIILTEREVNKIRYIDLLLHLSFFVLLSVIMGVVLKMKEKVYFYFQTIVCVLSCVCVWQQWFMPKVAFVVGCSSVIIVGIIYMLLEHKLKHICNKNSSPS